VRGILPHAAPKGRRVADARDTSAVLAASFRWSLLAGLLLGGALVAGLVLAGRMLAWPRWRGTVTEAEFPSEPQPATATLTPTAAAATMRTVGLMGIISRYAHTRLALKYVA
jgi:hypothetical protein